MGCSSCGKKKQKAYQQQQANNLRTREESTMEDKNYVLVLYTHPNRGKHGVVGAATKKDYGYRGGGDQFLVHIDDVKSRPDHFRIIQRAEKVSVPTPRPTPPPPPRPRANVQEMEKVLADPPHMQKVSPPTKGEDSGVDHVSERIIQSAKKGDIIDLSLLPGVTPAIEANLRKAGVTGTADFKELGVEGLVKIKFIGEARAEAIMAYIYSLDKVEEVEDGSTDSE